MRLSCVWSRIVGIGPGIALTLLAALAGVTVAACTPTPTPERVEVTREVPVEVTRVVTERIEVTRQVQVPVEVTRVGPERVEVTREIPVTRVVTQRVEIPGPVREVIREIEVPVAGADQEVIEAFEAVFAEFIAWFAEFPVESNYIAEAAYDAYLKLPGELQDLVTYEIPSSSEVSSDAIDESLERVVQAALDAGLDADSIFETVGHVTGEFRTTQVVQEVVVEVPVDRAPANTNELAAVMARAMQNGITEPQVLSVALLVGMAEGELDIAQIQEVFEQLQISLPVKEVPVEVVKEVIIEVPIEVMPDETIEEIVQTFQGIIDKLKREGVGCQVAFGVGVYVLGAASAAGIGDALNAFSLPDCDADGRYVQ